jgi:poly(A) polymerase Pap1
MRLPIPPGKYVHITLEDFLAVWHAVLWGDYNLIQLQNVESGFILPILRLKYQVVATCHGFAYYRAK